MNTESNNLTSIRIGYSLTLSGTVAENIRLAKLGHQLWEEDIDMAESGDPNVLYITHH